MKIKGLLLLMTLATCLSCAAYEVSLRALDPQGEPEAYATCRVFAASDTTRVVKGGVTDTLGYYKTSLPAAGDYRMVLEVAGKIPASRAFTVSDAAPKADLGSMTTGATDLDEVVVTAQRPLVVKEIDRIGYDVQADEDSKTVTIDEILRKVPMVSVDGEGNITINGSSNFKIYKNGRPNSSMTKNAKELFKALPASMIKKIEVITEPGAAYDAEGVAAILNIVTMENTVVKGVMGNASLRSSTFAPFNGANLWLTSQIDKVTFSLNAGMFNQTKKAGGYDQYSDMLYSNGTTRHTETSGRTKALGEYGGLELSWEPDTLNLFTIEGNLFGYNAKPTGSSSVSMIDADGNIIMGYDAEYYYPKYRYFDVDLTAAYQRSTHRKGETLTLSYMLSTNNENNRETWTYDNITGDAFPYTGQDRDYKLNFIEHTFQFDWSRPIHKIHTLDLGAKYVLRRNHSKDNSEYTGWEDRFTDFQHVTDIAAIYTQYSVKLRRVSLRAGLRYEFSRLKASYPSPSIPVAPDKAYTSDLNDWVPSAAASWQINDANSLTLNYSTRINRPGISYLNPAASISPTTVSVGNPDLASARHQSFKLQYMLIKPKATVNFSINYTFSNNAISSFQRLEDNIIYSSYDNIGRKRGLYFNTFSQFTFSPKTRLMLSLTAGRDSNTWDGYHLARWYYGAWMQLTQKLPWKLEASLHAWLRQNWINGVYGYANSKFGDRFSPSLSLKRSFLKDDRLSVNVSVNNLFGRQKQSQINVNGPYTGTSITNPTLGTFGMLSVSYRFGSLNAQVKKTKGRISNDDLSGQGGGQGGSQGGSGQQ